MREKGTYNEAAMGAKASTELGKGAQAVGTMYVHSQGVWKGVVVTIYA